MRLSDNRALAHASGIAQQHSIPLVVLYICSPSDWEAHDRSPRRIDFMLRQLEYLSGKLSKMDIPLYTVTWDDRTEIVKKLLKLLEEWGASHVFGNIEHEVDELRRDAEVVEKVIAARKKVKGWGGEVSFLNDMCIVPPGKITTQVRSSQSPFAAHAQLHLRCLPQRFLARQALLGLLTLVPQLGRHHLGRPSHLRWRRRFTRSERQVSSPACGAQVALPAQDPQRD